MRELWKSHRASRGAVALFVAASLLLAGQSGASAASVASAASATDAESSAIAAAAESDSSSEQAALSNQYVAEVEAEFTGGTDSASGSNDSSTSNAAIARASVLEGFQAGRIINDTQFYNGTTMTAAEVQTFLNARVSLNNCVTSGSLVCINAFTQTTTNKAGGPMCAAYTGAANESAATIITRVGQLCGISQEVLLTLIQKEQGLLTTTAPTAAKYQKATGYACPDTADCDARYYGFFNQVYSAAWQYKYYLNPPESDGNFTRFPVGQTTAVRFDTEVSCGTTPVYIENYATKALYYYTPYTPNEASLASYPLEGDSCSSYGNRNFYAIYANWFGSPNSGSDQYFTDVTDNNPFLPDVQWMARLGLSTGTAVGDGTRQFLPENAVSRQAMAAFLYRYSGETFTPPATASFSDVPVEHLFYTAIEWMKAKGYSTGYDDGTFQPAAPVSRRAAAAFLSKYAVGTAPAAQTAPFTDVPLGVPFVNEIAWLKSSGISTGNADGTFAPDRAVSRQAVAAFLNRLYQRG
jgi:hypothetical protein